MRLNLHHLRYFRAVAHTGNLTRAAEQLHVSQSALSLQIKKLEEELGHDLFERRGKRLELSETGRLALDYADAIFAAGEELVSLLQHGSGASRQTVRVGALSTLSRNFQVQFLRPALGRAGLSLVLRSGSLGELLRQLEQHRLDVVLTNLAPLRDDSAPWLLHKIAEQPVSLLAHRDRPVPDTLEALLASEPLLAPTVESSIRAGFDPLCERLGVSPRFIAEVDDMAMLRLLARENAGVALAPPIVVRDELASGLLVEAARLPELSETFYAITLARRFPNPILGELLAASSLVSGSG